MKEVKMQNYDWVLKSIIGITGTAFSVILENVSTFVSIIAGILTCTYMIFQVIRAYDAHQNRRADDSH